MQLPHGYIFDIKRYAVHDGPGIRVTLFLQGCPLRCWWCHNPEGLRALPDTSEGETNPVKAVRKISVDQALREIEKEVLFMDESGGGVTFSGGEPLVQHRFLQEMLSQCKKRDIHTALDTTGYAPKEVLARVMDGVDLFLYDVKLMDDAEHQRYTGVSNDVILQNLRMLDEAGKKIIIRYPLIPGATDAQANIRAMLVFLSELKSIPPVHILPYHKTAKIKYERLHLDDKLRDLQTPSAERIEDVKQRFEQAGFAVHIGG